MKNNFLKGSHFTLIILICQKYHIPDKLRHNHDIDKNKQCFLLCLLLKAANIT